MPAIRVGLCQTYEWGNATPEMQEIFASAGRSLSAAGWQVSDLTLPLEFAELVAVQTRTMAYEAAQAFAWERAAHKDQLSTELQRMIGHGLRLGVDVRDADVRRSRTASTTLVRLFDNVDVILTPSAPGEAPHGLQETGNPVFNRIWTLLGVPCIHLPFAAGTRGLPMGLQLIAPSGADAFLLNQAAHALRLLRG